jgi:hypothetical protein
LRDVAAAAPARPRRRWGRRILLGGGVFVLLLGAAAAVLYEPLLRHLLEREAERRGLVIQFDSVQLEPGSLLLRRVHVSLAGVPGLSADLTTVRLTLQGFTPRTLSARGVAIEAFGSAGDMLVAVSEWSSAHASTYRIPGACSDVRLTWAQARGQPPFLTASEGTLESAGTGGTFRAARAALQGVEVGTVGAAWSVDPAAVSIGVGKDSLDQAPIRADIRPTDSPPTATVTVRPVKLADLGAPLGVTLPTPGALIEGQTKLSLTRHGGKEVVRGAVAMSITGWTPPHPRELDGIVFGNRTTFTSNLELSADQKKVTLTDAEVAAGAFRVKGSGSIDRAADHALVRMDLSGSVRCTDLAQSAAASHLGDLLGRIVGDVARSAVGGSVAVTVRIEADSRDLKAARVQQSVGVGCGLRFP